LLADIGRVALGSLLVSALVLLAAPAPATRIEKLGRVLALEDLRSLGGRELIGYLGDPDRSVRRRAALAAGRIGDPATLDALQQQLDDVEPEVRQMAAFALGLIGDERAGARLEAALTDPDARVRGRAAEALGRLGDASRGAAIAARVVAGIPEGAPVLAIRGDDAGSSSDPWVELRLGLLALGTLGDAASAHRALLGEGGHPRFDWWASTWVAMRVGGAELRPVLDLGARSSDALSRAYAARGLGAFADPAAEAELIRLAADEDQRVAATALRALAVQPRSQAAAAAAREALDAQSPAVAEEALGLLLTLPPDRSLAGQVVDRIASRDVAIRAAALELLAHLDPEQFALVLSGLDPDPQWRVRAAVARGLARRGGEDGLAILFELLNGETDPRALPAVLGALRQLRGRDSIPTLVQHLAHADMGVRIAAAQGLAELRSPGHVPQLVAAWERGRGEAEVEARLALVDALAVEPDAAGREALERVMAEDPSRSVRESAARALGRKAPAGRPAPNARVRAPLDYHLAATPLSPQPGVAVYSPRAVIHTSRGQIELLLDVVEAPLATASFVELARRGYYEGLDFHRVVQGFVVQGGCPRGDGYGGPGYLLRSEIGQRPFGRGAVGLALAGPDTGGGQFFITQLPAPHLDGRFPLFGQVTRGLELVDALRPGDRIERVEVFAGS
jgi:cyclophilin family peptidyl-prolyl cis-trans isomerase/HEAT repeat protein